MQHGGADEDTVRLRPPGASRPGRFGWRRIAVGAGIMLLAAGMLAVLLVRSLPPVELDMPIANADEAGILHHPRDRLLQVFRFLGDPAVLVLDFADLSAQGRMLNRVAALTDKAGMPRDRVLADPQLEAAIRGSCPWTWCRTALTGLP